jgi:hypothetical protein
MRQQAAAGKGVDWPGMALIEQGNDGVDHGKAGADEQHRRLGVEVGERIRRPRIGAIEGAIIETGVGHRRRLGRKIANREHGCIGDGSAVPVELESKAAIAGIHSQHVAAHQLQPAILVGVPNLLLEQVADIAAKKQARHEAAGGGCLAKLGMRRAL